VEILLEAELLDPSQVHSEALRHSSIGRLLCRDGRFRTFMRAVFAISAVVAATIAAGPASAATISPAKVRFPQVAVGPSGRTVVAWERLSKGRFSVEARIGDRPQRLGPIVRLARVGYRPRVAVGADGTVAVEWMQPGPGREARVRVAIARRGHGYGRTQTVDQRKGNVGPVDVAVQPSGRVLALWQRSEGRFAYALAARGRRFGTARALTGAGALPSGNVAVDPRDGTIVLAPATQVSFAPPANQQASVRTLSMSQRRFTTAIPLTATGIDGEASAVAVSGPAGSGVAYTVRGSESGRLVLVRRSADGTWEPPQTIATSPPVEGVFALGLRVALPAGSAAVAAWSVVIETPNAFALPPSRQAVASIALPGAAFAAPSPVSPAHERYTDPAVAATGDEAFVASATPHGPVLLATRAAGAATFGQPVALSAKGDGDVVLAAGGSHVLAAYQRDDRLQLRVV